VNLTIQVLKTQKKERVISIMEVDHIEKDHPLVQLIHQKIKIFLQGKAMTPLVIKTSKLYYNPLRRETKIKTTQI
jgi:hypothetical protein